MLDKNYKIPLAFDKNINFTKYQLHQNVLYMMRLYKFQGLKGLFLIGLKAIIIVEDLN